MAIENLQKMAYAVITPLFSIAIFSILLRIYTRGMVLKQFGWDDWVMASLLVFNSGQQAILYVFLHHDAGKHIQHVSAYNFEVLIRWLFIEEIYYMFQHWIIKMGFLLFYLRLSRERPFLRWVYITMALNTMFTITNWLIACLQCTPLDAFFHPAAHPEAKCISRFVTFFVPAFLNITTDILILLIPIRTVWKLQMTLKRRIGVIVVIGCGGISVLISLLRLIVLYQFYSNPDFPYILGRMVIISCLEIEFAVIAANMPSIKALWKAKFQKGSGSGGYSDSYKLSSMDPSKGNRSIGFQPIEGSTETRDASARDAESWRNDSEEQLCGKSGQIKVTTDVAVRTEVKTESDETQAIPFQCS